MTFGGTRSHLHILGQDNQILTQLIQKGQWDYLPGASRQKDDSLRIHDRPFAIVAQDGSAAMPNPPVNLFGTHLEVSGDIALTAVMEGLQPTAEASLQLYGEVPLVFDEFRLERKSIRFTVADNMLTVHMWDGQTQQPAAKQSFPLEPSNAVTLGVASRGGQFAISANGKALGAIADHGIFSTGKLWFGASSTEGEWSLTQLRAEALGDGRIGYRDASRLHITNHAQNSPLQAEALRKQPGMRIGAAVALAPMVSDSEYAQLLLGGNFGAITTENALKWQFVHPQPYTYDFNEADALVELAKRHGLYVHGHTLVFGEANPRWLQDMPTATTDERLQVEQAMLQHIAVVASHYKGRVASWDVVNEPLADYDEFRDDAPLRNHKWHQAMGDEYISKALRAAREADPGALLFMNEYGLEEDGERWDALLQLVDRLQEQNVPLDGIGFQAHVYEPGDSIDPHVLRSHIRELASRGLKARISELDVYSSDGQNVQAQQYADVLGVCASEPACVAFTMWIPTDRYNMWQDDDGQLLPGRDGPWDAAVRSTPAVDKMLKVLSGL